MRIGKWIQILSKNVHKISCMGYELVLELGQKVGQLISKSEEKLWDIDIKNFTVSPLDQVKYSGFFSCIGETFISDDVCIAG